MQFSDRYDGNCSAVDLTIAGADYSLVNMGPGAVVLRRGACDISTWFWTENTLAHILRVCWKPFAIWLGIERRLLHSSSRHMAHDCFDKLHWRRLT